MILGPKQFAGTIKYYADGTVDRAVSYLFAQDLDQDGLEEVFVVGFESQPTTPETYNNTIVNIFGWENGQFINLTSKWLPGTSNQVGGVGDVGFGDFNGDGNIDVYLSAYTDMSHQVEAYVLWNNGALLRKESLGMAVWEHAVAVYDINQDGFDDVVTAGYSNNLRYLGSKTGLKGYNGGPGSSGVAVGDFLNDGSVTAVYVDAGSKSVDAFLYAFVGNGETNNIGWRLISTLPGPRIENLNDPALENTEGRYSLISSHDIRARALDFNADGLLDVVVFGYRFNAPNTIVHRSEIQFLENKGAGIFVDVTDQVRVGYDVTSMISYYPQVGDFNLDGLMDIFSSNSGDVTLPYNSTSLLLRNEDGQYVSTGKGVFDQSFAFTRGQGILTRGPGGGYYLVTEAAGKYLNPDADVFIQALSFPEREQSETLIGTDLPESIYGLEGDDTIHGLSGDDCIDGGKGYDVAVIRSTLLEATLQYGSEGRSLVITSLDGRDTLVDVEQVMFLDGTYTPQDLIRLLTPSIEFSVIRGGIATTAKPTLFDGDASLNLQYQLIDGTPDVVVVGSDLNDFIVLLGGGNKAINGGLGHDVIDGGPGSTFISGGGGNNTFFLDGRAAVASWSTITDFNLGKDKVTIWGWKAGVSRVRAIEDKGGAPGYEGLTLHFENLLPDETSLTNWNSNFNSISLTGVTLSAFGVSFLDDLNAQLISGANSHFSVGSVTDALGVHGYLLIS